MIKTEEEMTKLIKECVDLNARIFELSTKFAMDSNEKEVDELGIKLIDIVDNSKISLPAKAASSLGVSWSILTGIIDLCKEHGINVYE